MKASFIFKGKIKVGFLLMLLKNNEWGHSFKDSSENGNILNKCELDRQVHA